MRKIIKSIGTFWMIMFVFSIVKVSGDSVWIRASDDMLSGTDSACEEYWDNLKQFRKFKTIYIINRAWIPSARIISNK